MNIPFLALAASADVSELDGTVVFVTEFPVVATQHPAYQILHIPPPRRDRDRRRVLAQTRGRTLIATSQFWASLWADVLDVDVGTVQVVYPFAEPCFATQPRQSAPPRCHARPLCRRLSPEKGIYTLLAMLHNDLVASSLELTFTATAAGADKPQGEIIGQILHAHPGIQLVPARNSYKDVPGFSAIGAENPGKDGTGAPQCLSRRLRSLCPRLGGALRGDL